jgi:hypothetical protein
VLVLSNDDVCIPDGTPMLLEQLWTIIGERTCHGNALRQDVWSAVTQTAHPHTGDSKRSGVDIHN